MSVIVSKFTAECCSPVSEGLIKAVQRWSVGEGRIRETVAWTQTCFWTRASAAAHRGRSSLGNADVKTLTSGWWRLSSWGYFPALGLDAAGLWCSENLSCFIFQNKRQTSSCFLYRAATPKVHSKGNFPQVAWDESAVILG